MNQKSFNEFIASAAGAIGRAVVPVVENPDSNSVFSTTVPISSQMTSVRCHLSMARKNRKSVTGLNAQSTRLIKITWLI